MCLLTISSEEQTIPKQMYKEKEHPWVFFFAWKVIEPTSGQQNSRFASFVKQTRKSPFCFRFRTRFFSHCERSYSSPFTVNFIASPARRMRALCSSEVLAYDLSSVQLRIRLVSRARSVWLTPLCTVRYTRSLVLTSS